jgi:transcriptional regulator with XRE-family HTH domain
MIDSANSENPEESLGKQTLAQRAFGAKLKELRKAANLGQKEIGLAAGYSFSQIAHIEKGKRLPGDEDFLSRVLPLLRASEQEREELHKLLRQAKGLEPIPDALTPLPEPALVGEITPETGLTKQTQADAESPNQQQIRLWGFIALTLIVILGIWFLASRQPSATVTPTVIATEPAPPSTQPTVATSATPSFTGTVAITEAPSPDPSPTIIPFCGETGQSRTDPSIDYFVRHQGVSAFTVSNTSGLILNDNVRAVHIDTSGLWVGYFATDQNSTAGLAHFDRKTGTWANCNNSAEIAGQDINDITTDRANRLWIATDRNGIVMFDGSNWHSYTKEDGLPDNQVYTVILDPEDNIWVGTPNGVAVLENDRWVTRYEDELYSTFVLAIAFDSTGGQWFGHLRDGLSYFNVVTGDWEHIIAAEGQLGSDDVRDILVRPADVSSAESVWVATDGGGISQFENGNWMVTYQVEQGLPSNNTRALAIDRYNRVWVATARGVAYLASDNHWTTYHTLETRSIATGLTCPNQDCSIDDEHIWTGTAGAGLTHSRLPWAETTLDVLQVCFIREDAREQPACVTAPEPDESNLVTIQAPDTFAPGDQFRVEFVIAPREPYDLLAGRGDYMSNTDESDEKLYGAFYKISMDEGAEITSGEQYSFVHKNGFFAAPDLNSDIQEQIFTSTWRVWARTRYVGPYIQLEFPVRRP